MYAIRSYYDCGFFEALAQQQGRTVGFVLRFSAIGVPCGILAGFAMDDMMRDAGWRFLVIGRRIERLQS